MRGVVCSAMHTGTWFVIRLLERMEQGSVMPWIRSMRARGGLPIDWLHVHAFAVPDVHGTGDDWRFANEAFIELAVDSGRYPIVIPMRDPMLALITHRNRRIIDGSQEPLDGWLGGFRRLAEWRVTPHLRIYWFPVDRPDTEPQRRGLVAGLASFVGYDPPKGFVHEQAVAWHPENATKGDPSGLKAAYLAGDLAAVEDALPAEVAELRAATDVRRLCHSLGYNAPWMSADDRPA